MFGFAFCNEQNSGKIAFCKKQKVVMNPVMALKKE